MINLQLVLCYQTVPLDRVFRLGPVEVKMADMNLPSKLDRLSFRKQLHMTRMPMRNQENNYPSLPYLVTTLSSHTSDTIRSR